MNKRPNIHIVTCLFFALVFCVAGCATETVMSTGPKYPATDPSAVKIFLTEKPTLPFDEIGRVSVQKFNNLSIARTGDQMDQLLREQAAAIGGDAVMNITEDFASMSGVVVKFRKAAP